MFMNSANNSEFKTVSLKPNLDVGILRKLCMLLVLADFWKCNPIP